MLPTPKSHQLGSLKASTTPKFSALANSDVKQTRYNTGFDFGLKLVLR